MSQTIVSPCPADTSTSIKPLTSLDELLSFQIDNVKSEMIARNFSDNVEKRPENQPKLLVCHDMAGNYHEDKFCGGCPCDEPYYLTAWPYIDVFVYFSHNLVTIPTVGWTNCAHLHNVSVLGTFITEFDEGAKICEKLLEDRLIIDQACEKLSDIALKYNFEGWLLNIENTVKFDHISNLAYFVQKLTESCKIKLGTDKAKVIWYDSVTVNGDLKWQNELNELNEMFFLLCDAIFLNYTWKEENLQKSCDFNASIKSQRLERSQIFVGVDAFGRGCFGGGGFECRLAFREIEKFGLSTALFAPAWPYEHLGVSDFPSNNFKFWKLISNINTCRKVVKLPISTTFNVGKFVGCKDDDETCIIFNLSDQSQQPHFYCGGKLNDELKSFSYEFDRKFPNGQALTIDITGQKLESLRLFCCQIFTKSIFSIRIEFMTECTHTNHSIELEIQLGLIFQGNRRDTVTYKTVENVPKDPEDSLIRKKCQEFDALFADRSTFYDNLKTDCLKGRLQNSHFRSVCWKIFLGYLPLDLLHWPKNIECGRSRYSFLKDKYNVDPRSTSSLSTDLDLLVNNPLSSSDKSPWRQYFLDSQLLSYIKQDVDRIFPELTFFQSPKIRQMMLDILFVFSREFDHISYKQGMHEILGPLIFVLYADGESLAHALESKEFNCCDQNCKNKTLIQQVINANFIEHDAYTMFASVMEIIKDYYCYCKERKPQHRFRKISLVDTLFLSESERQKILWIKERQESPSTLVFKLDYLGGEFLESVDPVLYQHLEKLEIPPQVYGIRWLRLLFGREFPMQDLLYIWDAIFCFGPPFNLVDCIFVAMLCYIRNALLVADYSGCLHYLMHYPSVSDVNELLSFALHLLDPNKYERPPRLSPGKFVYVPPGTKPKNRHKHQYHYHPSTRVIQSLDRSLNLRSSNRFSQVPKEENMSSSVKSKFFKNSPTKTTSSNGASSDNPFDSRGSPPDAQAAAQKAKKAFAKKVSSEKDSPTTGNRSKIITEEELELLKEQVNCLQSRLSEVEFNARQAATKMMKLFDIMDDRLKVVSVMDDEELFDLIEQVRNLCQNLNGNSQKSKNGTNKNESNKTPENETPPSSNSKKSERSLVDGSVEIAKEAGNTPPKPPTTIEDQSNEQQDESPFGPIIISEKSRDLGARNEMTEMFFRK